MVQIPRASPHTVVARRLSELDDSTNVVLARRTRRQLALAAQRREVRNGNILWSRDLGDSIGLPTIDAAGDIYVSALHDHTISLHIVGRDGSLKSTFPVDTDSHEPVCSPVIGRDGSVYLPVYTPSGSKLYALGHKLGLAAAPSSIPADGTSVSTITLSGAPPGHQVRLVSTTVAVKIEGAVDLGGFQLALNFDPAVVRVEEVTLGNFLGSTGRNTAPLGPEIDNEMGTVRFGAFSFGDQPGPSGNGVLATLTLRSQAAGSSILDMQQVQVTDTVGRSQALRLEGGRVTVEAVGEHRVHLPLMHAP